LKKCAGSPQVIAQHAALAGIRPEYRPPDVDTIGLLQRNTDRRQAGSGGGE